MPSKLGRGLLVFLMLVVAVVSWQWIEDHNVDPLNETDTINMSETRSDYYLEDFEIVNITNKADSTARAAESEAGTPADRQLKITGQSLLHLHLEGHSIIEQPTVRLLTVDNGLWQAYATDGTVSADFQVLDLQGDVEVTHTKTTPAKTRDNLLVTVNTESVSINTGDQTIYSSEPVQVTGDGWQYKAQSMNAEIGQGILSFTSGVEAQFESPNSPR